MYIASKFENRIAVRKLIKIFTAEGHTITRDWTRSYPPPKASDRLKKIIMGEITRKNLKGVVEADAIVFLAPGRRGAHGELSVALVLNKYCFLVGEQELNCMPVCHPDIIVCESIDVVLNYLDRLELLEKILESRNVY